jgi:hypothetical protein
MSKFAFEKKDVHKAAAEEQVAHKHVPGVAYEINDPAVKLMHTIGGGFFNEPKYYDSNRDYEAFITELTTVGRIESKIVNEVGLTEQAQEVIETAQAVAKGDHPEDLFIIASWARDKTEGLRLRTTPQMMLVVAAANEKTRPFLAKYGPRIMDRADEPLQVFAAFRHLYQRSKPRHKGALPHALRKALCAAIARFSEYEILKYDTTERPNYADLLKMLRGSKHKKLAKAGSISTVTVKVQDEQGEHEQNKDVGWPVSKSLFDFLVNGVVDGNSSPLLQARKKFFGLDKKDVAAQGLPALGVTPDFLRLAGLTWENVLSHLGSSKEVWELCIPMMGEMALTRNLRNFEQAKISDALWSKVYEKLQGKEDSVQLPFRWFTAKNEVSTTEAKTVIDLKLDQACNNIADLPGITVVLTDNSGSATGCATSAKSRLVVADAGNMLMAVLAKKLGRRVKIGVFGDMLVWVPFSQADTCLAIHEQVKKCAQSDDPKTHGGLGSNRYGGGVGGGTETGLWWGLKDITDKKLHVDRIIIMSDFCCYTQGNANLCHGGKDHFKGMSVQSMCADYRQKVNAQCKVYSINLNGHGQAQVKPTDKQTHLLSGWSEKLVNIIADCEGLGEQEQGEAKEVPPLEVLRAKYKIA